tara:strand:+ start:128 stop:565 length:438 start_codon:yes stop_codon:yes gene_type:complete
MNYYNSITELPIYNFDVMCKTGDVSYLLKDGKDSFPEDIDEIALWSDLYNEFLETFGLSDKFKKYLKLRAKATKLYKEALVDGHTHKITFAKLADMEAIDAIQEVDGGDLSKTSASLSKFYGFRINPMEISVKEYYSYVYQADNG